MTRVMGMVLLCWCSLGWAESSMLKYSLKGVPTTIDPVESATTYSNILVTSIFDTLYEYKYLKVPYELRPSLAESMPTISADGLTFTIKIIKGVFFTDDPAFTDGKGREVLASDFVYSIKRSFDPKMKPQGTWLWQERIVGIDDWKTKGSLYDQEVEGLKALDSHTIQIKLTKPYPQFLYTLAMGYSAIVAKEVVDKYGREITIHPVGSGAWTLKSYDKTKAVLTKNPKFRKETMDLEGYDEKIHGFSGIKKLEGKQIPILETIEVSFIEEESARWASFNKDNEIQSLRVPFSQLPTVLKQSSPLELNPDFAKKYNGLFMPEFGYTYVNFNMEYPEIGYNKDPKQNEKNKALRCAIRKGFNWADRIKIHYGDIGQAFPGIIPQGSDGYDPSLSRDSVTNDVEGAKKILAEAGWNEKNLPELEYGSLTTPKDRQFYEQFRGWMSKIGYPKQKIKQKTFSNFGDYSKAISKKEVMIIPIAWGLDYPDAENVLQLYYGPNASPGSNNSNFNNPAFNDLYKKISVMMPSPERTEIYKKMNQMIIDECVAIAGFSRSELYLWHKNVIMYPSENVIGSFFKYVAVE